MEKKIVQVGGKTFKLIFDDFNDEINVDEFLKIDYSNLIGEMVTFPVIVNRFGQMLAETESQVSEAKLNLEIFEAKSKESLRAELAEKNGGKNPTIEALNNAVVSSDEYKKKKTELNEAVKTRDYINSVFWSSKDKSSKIDKLSLTISPSEVSDMQIEGRVNNALIKRAKKLID